MEGTVAEIKYFAGNYAPRCWAFCQGQMMSIASNQSLFSLLGNTYGGDGRTTFALPKLEDLKTVDQVNYQGNCSVKAIICIEGVYPSRP
jgi:microcystin-dependent protein